ncbi:MAG TPA: hypothetical protein DE060_16440 [Lentisphaeria bacterium]|nr:hypothetical protein [Lentisphaeria bacterium]HCG50779.1 hypothetical protein [Lentisphaeria bacterium]
MYATVQSGLNACSARTWLGGLNTRDCRSTPNALAIFKIRFRGINLKNYDNTVILCFDGFMIFPYLLV